MKRKIERCSIFILPIPLFFSAVSTRAINKNLPFAQYRIFNLTQLVLLSKGKQPVSIFLKPGTCCTACRNHCSNDNKLHEI